jgi:hypothetical protein
MKPWGAFHGIHCLVNNRYFSSFTGGGWLRSLAVSKFSFADATSERALFSARSRGAVVLSVSTISSARARKVCASASLARRWFRGAELSRLHKAKPSA